MTNHESLQDTPSMEETLISLFGVTAEEASILLHDEYTRSIIDANFSIVDTTQESGRRDLDPVEFIQGRLSYLRTDAEVGHATEQKIREGMIDHSDGNRQGDNNK